MTKKKKSKENRKTILSNLQRWASPGENDHGERGAIPIFQPQPAVFAETW
ncbi:hypothetical protein BREVNS_0881 [Brevinematales bacterium NS]|nr:hypothetical protein BREVNS_0881 [Brevinematales bacterium NS]